MERLAEITYPRPLEELLDAAFERYCREVPWARDFRLEPKSVLRDMLESASDFKGYVQRYGIARSEGTLLRYLSDAYRVLDRTVPADKRDERLADVIAWLGFVVRSVDSSLVDEWESAGAAVDVAPPTAGDVVVHDRRGLTVLVRNALFQRVRLALAGTCGRAGQARCGMGLRRAALAARPRRVLRGARADSPSTPTRAPQPSFPSTKPDEQAERVWHVRQIFSDPRATTISPSRPTSTSTLPRRRAKPCSRTSAWASSEELGE